MERRRTLDEICLHLKKNTYEDIKSSEVIINYNNSFQFSDRMECSLINLNIPPKLFTYGIPQVSLDFVFHFVGLTNDPLEVINNANKPLLTDMDEKFLETMNVNVDLNNYNMTTKQVLQNIEDVLNTKIKTIVGSRCNLWRPNSYVDGKFVNKVFEKSLTFSFKLENGMWKINFGSPGQLIFEIESGVKKVIAKYHYCPGQVLHNLFGITDEYPLVKVNPRKNGIYFSRKEYSIGDLLSVYENRLVSVHCSIIQNSYINNHEHFVLKQFFLEKDKNLYRFKKNYFIPLRVNEFETISLSLKDTEGNNLYFPKGYIAYTIMLRKI